MYNCETVSILKDKCYLIIENFNFESDKNNDNGVYSFEIRIDENDIKESKNIPILLPKNGNNIYLTRHQWMNKI